MSAFAAVAKRAHAWWRYREAIKELSQLSDQELSEIGIRRCDIQYIVRESMSS